MVPWARPSLQPKRHLDRFSRFRTAHRRVSLYLTMGRPFPFTIVPWAYWSLQPKRYLDRFSHFRRAHYCVMQTDRQTDHAAWSV